MRILNYGSLNLDYVYTVNHIVQPGETISSDGMTLYFGGKGLNQSISLARAGSQVCHAGMIGPDGAPLLAVLQENGVNTDHIREVKERTGNAMIQVGQEGQNSIVLFGGANQKNETEYIDEALSCFAKGDLLLLQNEVNLLDYMIERGSEKGLRIALNPSPYDEKIERCDLSGVSLLLINEVEGEQMTGRKEPRDILTFLFGKFPAMSILLTLGKNGALYIDDTGIAGFPVFDVQVVDTTAAGDTFTGYFITALSEGKSPYEALRLASLASALAVSRPGASVSIPWRDEVDNAEIKLVL